MKNIKIRARMIISYLIVAALLVISGVVSVSVINKVSKSMESFYENQFHTIENACLPAEASMRAGVPSFRP